MRAYVIHENDDWMPPLRRALDAAGLPYEEWFIDEGHFDVQGAPPEGVFLNRMSASSHTRNHTAGVEHTRQLLAWLERHGRRVVNGRNAFELEVSKVKQHLALEQVGLRTPATRAVAGGPEALIRAAQDIPTPFVTKHNRGGKGLGVQLFRTREVFADYVRSDDFEAPPAHVTLLQQYVESVDESITRCEFVDGELLYAIRSDTSEGFELCPADACRTDETCAIDGDDSLFSLREDVPAELVDRYKTFLDREDIDVAGIEFIEDAEGQYWTYDVNGTTNYSPEVEDKHDLDGMSAVARLLERELQDAASGEHVPS
jgi:glutathione synthase/RimK-type ligase-like ATP-grasp enzyme